MSSAPLNTFVRQFRRLSMNLLFNRVIALLLGIVFVWCAIFIVGIGAAIAVPAALLQPLALQSVMLAFTLVDLVTIALPLAAAFLLLALAAKLTFKHTDFTFYLLMLMPFLMFNLYFLLAQPAQFAPDLLSTVPRYLLLAICVFYLQKPLIKY